MADYAGVLADLKGRRAALTREVSELDEAIAAIERLVLRTSLGGTQAGIVPPANPSSSILVPSRAFAGLNVQQAIAKYMIMVGGSQSTRQITEALRRGGLETKSRKPYAIVYNTLHRLSSPTGSFERTEDGLWKLRGGRE